MHTCDIKDKYYAENTSSSDWFYVPVMSLPISFDEIARTLDCCRCCCIVVLRPR